MNQLKNTMTIEKDLNVEISELYDNGFLDGKRIYLMGSANNSVMIKKALRKYGLNIIGMYQ